MTTRFTGNFTQQDPLPPEALEAAMAVLRSGRLHRYNLSPGETGQVAALEAEFAAYTGARYCLAVTSGGYAMQTALRALGIGPGDLVASNAFTLAPVPGAIASVGAAALFVEVTPDLTIDLVDLEAKLARHRPKALLLSHMRGHVCDMEALMAICDSAGVPVIEDCAHTMGAHWRDLPSGRHGRIGCYSTQTYKHMNSGEGGFLVTDDAQIAATAVLLSGSYMLYARHGAAPEPAVFEGLKYDIPNVSGRMDHLRAAILRPQLARLDGKCADWTARYRVLETGLTGTPGLTLIARPAHEHFVGSSFQALLLDWPDEAIRAVLAGAAARGVEVKWFGAEAPVAFTSTYRHWHYAAPQAMPASDRILRAILDLRLPLTFSLEDCALIATILREEITAACPARAAAE